MKDKDLAKICAFKIENGNVFYQKNIKTEEEKEILEYFNKNIKKYTFLGLILPCVSFLLIFLLTTLYLIIKEFKGNFNSLVFIIFVILVFAFLGFVLFYKIVIKKEKCYLTKKYNAYQYKYISNDEYKKICYGLKREDISNEKKL